MFCSHTKARPKKSSLRKLAAPALSPGSGKEPEKEGAASETWEGRERAPKRKKSQANPGGAAPPSQDKSSENGKVRRGKALKISAETTLAYTREGPNQTREALRPLDLKTEDSIQRGKLLTQEEVG